MADPKTGTGKKPKGSGRRLYTDENPKDTVRIKFATPTDARKTVAKVKKISKPYARKIQILTVGEQRAKVMGKTKVASIFKKVKKQLEEEGKKMSKVGMIAALRARYEADIAEADATINIYLTNSVGIGEHPQHLQEIDKLLAKIGHAKEKLESLEAFEK